jgi:glutamine synthetase
VGCESPSTSPCDHPCRQSTGDRASSEGAAFSIDSSFDFRNAVMELLVEGDFPVSKHRAQISGLGMQAAIDLDKSDLVSTADCVLTTKYLIRRLARRHGYSATFLPKPIAQARGSGMPVQLSLWRGDEPIFAGQGYGGLSDTALYTIGGILHHAASLTALCNPLTNSYRRLQHTSQHPFYLGYAQQSRQSMCNIPAANNDPRAKCIEILTPDLGSNPYLTFAAILMAAIDGIQNKLEAGPPLGVDAKSSAAKDLPKSLWDALNCLEQDTEFLVRGDVFSPEMLARWIEYKREIERPALESYPTPAEYDRYFDC